MLGLFVMVNIFVGIVEMKKKFRERAKQKGYELEDLCRLWGLKERQMYNIFRAPKPLHEYALKGLPRKTKNPKG